jgi:redox-sensitive bicupin YhaK (pirin superfamily)
VFAAILDGADAVTYALPAGHKAYVHVARGEVELNGQSLTTGDGAKIATEPEIRLANGRGAEVLLFDLT